MASDLTSTNPQPLKPLVYSSPDREPLAMSRTYNLGSPRARKRVPRSPTRIERTDINTESTEARLEPIRNSPARNSPVRNNPGSPPGTPLAYPSPTSSDRQVAELRATLTAMAADYKHLEEDAAAKTAALHDISAQLAQTEAVLKSMEVDRARTATLHEQEVAFMKESMEELQLRNTRLTQKLQAESSEAYQKLYRSVKALQSSLELEQNSKALLIEQIEYLTKERDYLLDQASLKGPTQPSSEQKPQEQIPHVEPQSELLQSAVLQSSSESPAPFAFKDIITSDLEVNNSDLDKNVESDSESDASSDGSVHGTQLMSSLAEFDSSSPIKDNSSQSLELPHSFQFPANERFTPLLPDPPAFSPPLPDSAAAKRSSLPARLKATGDDEFVLSPLKLTSQTNSSYFDGDSSGPNSLTGKRHSLTHKRSSHPKPGHSRYNSHDIIPIKVEFESLGDQLRSTSAPEKDLLEQQLESVAETNPIEDDCDMAFMKLNGYTARNKRDSLLTTSSKRSSLLTDFNISSGDITKQEITKLKFELQSLKLHNEKLLSYIGFELQKQKKNIKKLSSKQNLRAKVPGNMEYSDAKLIEKSKDMLIHKKRVLRSVSINPILSTKYASNRNSMILQSGIGLSGISNINEDDEEFVFKSPFINSLKEPDCDDYGFLNHQSKYSSRVLSNKNQDYLNQNDSHTVKKFRSQTFAPKSPKRNQGQYSDEDSSMMIEEDEYESDNRMTPDIGLFDVEEIDGYEDSYDDIDNYEDSDEDSEYEESSVSEVDYDKLNKFNQMRYLIMGKEHMKRSKRADGITDENLRYKFLTIVLGIVIVGIKFTSHQQPSSG